MQNTTKLKKIRRSSRMQRNWSWSLISVAGCRIFKDKLIEARNHAHNVPEFVCL